MIAARLLVGASAGWQVSPVVRWAHMLAPTLRWIEEAVASQALAAGAHSIGDELFPRLDHARSLEELEQTIHRVGQDLAWLGDALVVGPERAPSERDAMARAAPGLLALQDRFERLLEAEIGKVGARKALVVHETLRRFQAACAQPPRGDSEQVGLSGAARPSLDYIRGIAVRLALLVLALEHLAERHSPLLAPLADRAFETSQTLRRAAQALGLDLTPWLDAPPATRWRHITEAARGFWGALDEDQRRGVGEAWSERVDLPLP